LLGVSAKAMETEIKMFPIIPPDMYSETLRQSLRNSPPVTVRGGQVETPLNKIEISRIESGCDGSLCPTLIEYTTGDKRFSLVVFCDEYVRSFSTDTLSSGEVAFRIYLKVRTLTLGILLTSFGPVLSFAV
jgi:hypothetical protein